MEYNMVDPVVIYSCEAFSIKYDLSLNYFGILRKEKIELEQKPYITIECNKGESLEWYFRKIFEIKRIIEIATGNILSLSKVIACKFTSKLDDTPKRPLEIIHCFKRNNQGEKNKILPYDYLFNLTELTTAADILNWFKANKKMEPIVELYIEDLYNKQLSVSRRFLNMVQALEIYHSRMVCNGNLSDYKKRVKEIISDELDDWKDKYRTFLLGDVYKNITLQQRLADLLIANFNINFYTGDIEYYEFPKLISQTGNYYIHYNPKLEDAALKGERLVNAYRVLRVILEYYLLKELGFNDRIFILEKIKNRTTPIRTHIEISKLNEKMYNKQ